MADFIPSKDPDFDLWLSNLVTVVGANPAAYGVAAADLDAVNTAKAAWATAYSDNNGAQIVAQQKTQAKNTARGAAESAARTLVGKIQAVPSVTDEAKTAAQVPVRDTTRTRAAAPTTAPAGTIDTSRRRQHTIHFRDETTPGSKAKPKGVLGCEIYIKVGDPAPTSERDLDLETLDTRTPHVIQFDAADAGKTVHYWLRWVNLHQEKGPWGAPISATIVG